MFGELLTVVFFLVSIISSQILSQERTLRDGFALETEDSRQAKFFPLFSVVRFANSQCSANNNFNGTCYTRRECSKYGGSACGTCANKLGVCCVFQKICGSTTHVNNTYFVNPGYPSKYHGGDRCTITIYRCNTNICQLRIDFLDFSLAQPNGTGICDLDFMIVSGGSSRVPRLCGENANQHVYIDFDGDNPITISIDTNPDFEFGRHWNLRMQQIECDAVWRAPNGCLQYYTMVTGTVMSFNYGSDYNMRDNTGTRQLTNANYGVCIRKSLGYCSIEWSQTNKYSFTLSDDTSGYADEIIGTWLTAQSGTECMNNYVIIKNPNINGTDRFCGNGFITKSSDLKPFVLSIVTNGTPYKTANRGFILMWKQQACAV